MAECENATSDVISVINDSDPSKAQLQQMTNGREIDDENFKKIDIQMGKRLADDIIDAYCNKLQEGVAEEIDGMLAMQYILLEPNSMKDLIKGDRNTCQVIYDHCRSHYLVLFRNKLNPKRIVVYDPIVPKNNSVAETLNDSVRQQILILFGHLYEEDERVEIAIETGLSTQNDCWSCGLRAVAFITHLLLGINPASYEYDLEKIRKFILKITKMDRLDLSVIVAAQLGQEREGSKSCLAVVRVTKGGKFAIENETAYVISEEPSAMTEEK
ncbi:unnamed protein product [Litomosoides sigmodontis]|uniref:Ubiquitin-like protease family profile domain-containing protein n=1 Tax=Litomosoides sigmodontis TaxID=42156 RepID=A0A3P6SI17_LITSI|nr:unnamed protein product [Litomosoides sigmodontis]